jgi:hypothetical protein
VRLVSSRASVAQNDAQAAGGRWAPDINRSLSTRCHDPLVAHGSLSSLSADCSSAGAEWVVDLRKLDMMRTVAHLMPFVALGGGILILVKPPLLNYVVAVYLILVGTIGLNHTYHFIR